MRYYGDRKVIAGVGDGCDEGADDGGEDKELGHGRVGETRR
jgi:hypothetical protein